MKLIAYNSRVHRPSCKRVANKGALVPIAKAVKATPATCCHPERLDAWKIETTVLDEVEVEEIEVEDAAVEDVSFSSADDTVVEVEVDEIERIERPVRTADAPQSTIVVQYPQTLAKHFFRALARVAGALVAESTLVEEYKSHETPSQSVTLTGPTDDVTDLGWVLPQMWIAADASLKQWRKTSPNYKMYNLSDKAEAKLAYQAEQDYLIDFCRGSIGHKVPLASPDGLEAGRPWSPVLL